MRSRATLSLVGVLLLLFGCSVGREFQRPEPGSLRMGSTTESEIRARFGRPHVFEATVLKENAMRSLGYVYRKVGLDQVYDREVMFIFGDGVLVGYEYSSSFTSDKTDFDQSRVDRIKRGETTAAQVVDILGPPAGQGIHPLAEAKTGKAYVYSYVRIDKEPFSGKLSPPLKKRLVVQFDEAGVVSDFRLYMVNAQVDAPRPLTVETRPPASATPLPRESHADEATIRGVLDSVMDAINQRDVRRLLDQFADDAQIDSKAAGGKVSKRRYGDAMADAFHKNIVPVVRHTYGAIVVGGAVATANGTIRLGAQSFPNEWKLEKRAGRWMIVETRYK